MIRSFDGALFLDADVHHIRPPPAVTKETFWHFFSRMDARPNRTRRGSEAEPWRCTCSEASVLFSGDIIGAMDLNNFCFRILK